ncbi:MAG TPA: outer membrane beta-barrel protein [Candidatus Acidoferrum sp.]|nr:outer membrane beta-barrel protein [Candidatus Acidoferrum sp.]
MRKWLLLFAVMFLLPTALAAQEESPKAEVFAGYSYGRVHVSGAPAFNMNGASASVSFNPTRSLGIVADFGGYHVGNIGGASVDANVYTYLFGPKVAYRHGRFTPYAQALFGGAHASASAFGISGSDNSFAMALGGGVDVNATEHIGIRLIQAEYLMTRFSSETQNNARISAGIVFRF